VIDTAVSRILKSLPFFFLRHALNDVDWIPQEHVGDSGFASNI